MNTEKEREALRRSGQDSKIESRQAAEYWTKRAATMHRNAVEALREAGEIPTGKDLRDLPSPGVYTANVKPVKIEDLPEGPYNGLPVSTVKALTGKIKTEDLKPAELTGEAAQAIRAAAERMRRGEERITMDINGAGTVYKQIVEITEQEMMKRTHAAELALAHKRAPIIAVDFDGTLCEQAWPGIGDPKWWTIQALIAAQAAGARLILWTNRVGARLREAVEWCRNRELEFDAVNENLPEVLERFTTNPRKVYADIYLDDKAAQPSAAVLGALWDTARDVMNGKPGSGEEAEQP